MIEQEGWNPHETHPREVARIVEETDREYAAGEALDTLEPLRQEERQGCSQSAPAGGWTAPRDIPKDVAAKLVACRDALLQGDTDEAWHQLYAIADPTFSSLDPWLEVEQSIGDSATAG